MPAAARMLDTHSCPLTVPVAHTGGLITGPLLAGSVFIDYRNAATQGTVCACGLGPPNTVAMGSGTVMIAHRPAARMGDPTTHGGTIISGCPTVLIG